MKVKFELDKIEEIASLVLEKTIKHKWGVGAKVILMHGDLGAGKTTLSKSIAKHLGVKEKIVSPTFVIMKRYKTKHKDIKNLIHIDAYRLESGMDLEKLGFKNWLLEDDSLIIIEWPENVSQILSDKFLKIFLLHKDNNTRLIKF